MTTGKITNQELVTDIQVGSLSSLTTSSKTNVTSAINELKSDLSNYVPLSQNATTSAPGLVEISASPASGAPVAVTTTDTNWTNLTSTTGTTFQGTVTSNGHKLPSAILYWANL